jgi:hypothetical protein
MSGPYPAWSRAELHTRANTPEVLDAAHASLAGRLEVRVLQQQQAGQCYTPSIHVLPTLAHTHLMHARTLSALQCTFINAARKPA